MLTSVRILRRRWGRATFPVAYLSLVALPLSLWASPGADRLPAIRLAASIGLFLLVSIAGRRRRFVAAAAYFAAGVLFCVFRGHFAVNEFAGVMLLFVPLATALAAGGAAVRGTWRLSALSLTLLYGGFLVTAGSRGGSTALALAIGAMLLCGRRRGYLTLALAVASALVLSPWWQEVSAIRQKSTGAMTIEALFTGRVELWRGSLQAISDFSWTGIGIGAFNDVVATLYYPMGSEVKTYEEHAHSLVLQTALDVGVGGLLALLAIVWVAFRRSYSEIRRAPDGSLRRVWARGLFGSLVAFTAFNLFDDIALGTLGGMAFWFLLGLIFALPRCRRRGRPRWRPRTLARARRRLALAAILTLLGLPSLRRGLELNRAAVLAARAVLREPELLPQAHSALEALRPRICRAGWLEGKVAAARGLYDRRDAAWQDLADCSPRFQRMLEKEVPTPGFLRPRMR